MEVAGDSRDSNGVLVGGSRGVDLLWLVGRRVGGGRGRRVGGYLLVGVVAVGIAAHLLVWCLRRDKEE